jgi:hypothetical protein
VRRGLEQPLEEKGSLVNRCMSHGRSIPNRPGGLQLAELKDSDTTIPRKAMKSCASAQKCRNEYPIQSPAYRPLPVSMKPAQ